MHVKTFITYAHGNKVYVFIFIFERLITTKLVKMEDQHVLILLYRLCYFMAMWQYCINIYSYFNFYKSYNIQTWQNQDDFDSFDCFWAKYYRQ